MADTSSLRSARSRSPSRSIRCDDASTLPLSTHLTHVTLSLSLCCSLCTQYVDDELLGWWLCERQCDSGGLNGRPEKQADVCYSWWNITSLIMIGKLDWINKEKLIQFILDCQDLDDGGIADRPGNVSDVFHTFFGICGLCMLGYFDREKANHPEYAAIRQVHPVFAIPEDTAEKLQLAAQIIPPKTLS